jgi:hypothetical protein
MTTDVRTGPAQPIEAPRRRRWLLWLVVAAAVLVAVAVVAVVAVSDHDPEGASAVGTQQLASISKACATWQSSYGGTSPPPSAWCDMARWMATQGRSGHMTGSMMWSNPAQMRTTCEQRMSSRSAAGRDRGDGLAWCDQMVSWMTAHMGSWDHWDQGWMMMNGSMMGG